LYGTDWKDIDLKNLFHNRVVTFYNLAKKMQLATHFETYDGIIIKAMIKQKLIEADMALIYTKRFIESSNRYVALMKQQLARIFQFAAESTTPNIWTTSMEWKSDSFDFESDLVFWLEALLRLLENREENANVSRLENEILDVLRQVEITPAFEQNIRGLVHHLDSEAGPSA
jgi:hypothetical protein